LRDHPVYLAKIVNVSACQKNMKDFKSNMEKLILKLLIKLLSAIACWKEKNLSDKQKVQNSQQKL
jgi:hypothetical protein